ncbi:MAG: rod shape-determining protein MreD [Desulfomonilaceae bacterium]|nr:rod shape-determining protein MreD [Desulfomonilaceae bacterium]
MRVFTFIVLGCLVVVIVQVASIGFVVPAAYKPDIMLILVVWAGIRLEAVPGIVLAFFGGIVVDIFSGSPTGLFALVYCLTFVASGSANSTFDIDTPVGRALVVFVAALLTGVFVVLTRWFAGPLGAGTYAVPAALAKSLITGLTSLAVFPLLDRSWAGYEKLVGER